MHDLLFTLPDDDYPFVREVRARWCEGVFVLSLINNQSVVSTSEAREDGAAIVLDGLLSQLVGSA